MTVRRATFMLLRAVLRAPATVSPAAIVCASADLFRVPECSKATVSIPPPKIVCRSSSRARVAFNSPITASASSATTISSRLIFLYSTGAPLSPILCLLKFQGRSAQVTSKDLLTSARPRVVHGRLLRSLLHCRQVAGAKYNRHVDATYLRHPSRHTAIKGCQGFCLTTLRRSITEERIVRSAPSFLASSFHTSLQTSTFHASDRLEPSCLSRKLTLRITLPQS